DLTLAYALKWRRLDIEPFVDHYNYPRQADSPATEMAGVTLTYPVGAVNVFTRQAWDIGEYGGASFADFGASAEKELGGKLSGKASLGLGAGSRNFNLTYLGLRKGALNHAGAELELTYRFGKGCFLRPHTEASGLLDSDLRGQVETPDLMSGGIALGWEF
ncbi:MAG: hypothetical protein HY548_08465, partial [Elusimicrobia bacterium]|nr:hypothetical protein [Elusimicrobiota bacterium]